jgi:hypothetical protein
LAAVKPMEAYVDGQKAAQDKAEAQQTEQI